ncbi:MAG: fatty acid oxidation complex subunit alpha FadJ [Deltaproteobacteria bacterium]|nr:fatty acid oxidation complex subunit alpha FadJ [Deltaproteobacteria bacterium]
MTTKSENSDTGAESFRVERRDDGVAVVLMDVPGATMNTLNARFADEFDALFGELSTADDVRAIVFASGKTDSFIAGADISMLEAAKTAADATEISHRGQGALNRVEALGKPVVAAIHGPCLGGGLEVALACHARVASDHRKTKLGLPEVQLGLLPGAGGTQRLPRLIGVQKALDLMLTGKQIDSKRAKRMGLVDEVVPQAILLEVAIETAQKLAGAVADDDQGGHLHLPDTDELQELALTKNPLGRKVLFDQAVKQLRAKTRGNYPAPEKILEAVRTGLADGFDAGLEAERRLFGELTVSPEAAALMSIFFATTALKKDSGVDDESVSARPVTKVGMLGAGLMGGGIAYVTSSIAKVPVRIKDRDDAGVLRGLSYVREIVDKRLERRRITKLDADRLMTMISGTTSYDGLGDAEVIIEAVFEDLEVKHRVLQDTEAATGKDTIFASNTSSLPITRIAEGSAHPETVIGMHYFSPVHKMPLLEIITTEATADWVTATCVALGKAQGKTVIVVRDGVGFYTTRILAPFMNEAAHVLSEGAAVDRIDDALMDFGYPVGPIKLTDEVGIDVGAKVGKILLAEFGQRMQAPEGINKLVQDDRKGRKNGRGFYHYGDDKKGDRVVDESVYALLGVKPTNKVPSAEITERCTLQMVNEAIHCLCEGILRSPRDGDIGAIFGLGFPPFRGGPFRYVDAVGAPQVLERIEHYRDRYGARFEPAPLLVEKAKDGATFY